MTSYFQDEQLRGTIGLGLPPKPTYTPSGWVMNDFRPSSGAPAAAAKPNPYPDLRPRNASGAIANQVQPFGIQNRSAPSWANLNTSTGAGTPFLGAFRSGGGGGYNQNPDYLNRQMSNYFDTATGQMQGYFKQGLNTLRDQMADPNYAKLMQTAMSRLQNPGLTPAQIGAMQGAAASRGAANLGAQMGMANWNLAGRGVSGAARQYLLSSMQNKAGANMTRTAANIDLEAAKFAKGEESSAMSQAAGLLGQKSGLAQMFANYVKSYNPLEWMGQIQQMQSPFTQIGYGQSRLMA